MVINIIIAVGFGLVAGIFVNMLADDLPLRRSVRTPRYVPDAKKRAIHVPVLNENGEDITWEFVHEDDKKRPLIAWLGLTAFLTGHRNAGDVKLSWRYPLTEVLCVVLMVLTVLAIQDINAAPDTEAQIGLIQTFLWLFYMGVFALVIVIDIEHKLILFIVILPATAVALIDAIITPYPPGFVDALVGAAAGFGVFFIMYNGGFLFTYIMGVIRGNPISEVAFGYGDVMMAMLAGAILGWRILIFAMFITVFLGAFGAIAFLLGRALSGGKYSAFTALPYGPYIVAGTILMLLYGDTLGRAMFGAVMP